MASPALLRSIPPTPPAPAQATPWYLLPFANVRRSEVGGVLLLATHVFLLLASYYLLKTAREPLILLSGGAEVKSYAAAAQAVLLIGVVKGLSMLAARFDRARLVVAVTLFFAANLVVFGLLAQLALPIGVPFFLWVGVFNVAVLAQFWSFATDAYTPEQGKRLFGIIGVGSSIGAIFGARVARKLFAVVGVSGLIYLAAAGLLLAAFVALMAGRRRSPSAPAAATSAAGDGFALLRRDRYLQLAAGLALLLTIVNTTGEYVLDKTLLGAAHAQTQVPLARFVADFKGRYFEWVNVIGVVLQLFVVSRFLQHAGVRVALLVLPLVALGGYTALALMPMLPLVFAAKVAENSLDYSLQNTTRQALFLPTSADIRFHGKALIDTVLVRSGDVIASGLVWVGHQFAFGAKQFALLNTALVLVWIGLAIALGSRYQALSRASDAGKDQARHRTPARTRLQVQRALVARRYLAAKQQAQAGAAWFRREERLAGAGQRAGV